jgi:hypothetical protein
MCVAQFYLQEIPEILGPFLCGHTGFFIYINFLLKAKCVEYKGLEILSVSNHQGQLKYFLQLQSRLFYTRTPV